MIKIEGEMIVNTIDGRYGPFNTAVLYSSIGDFVVKYKGLDEFNSGQYTGTFVVLKTYTRIRKFGVSKIIEPIVEIESVELDSALEGEQRALPDAIVDPIIEDQILDNKADEPTQKLKLPEPDDADVDVIEIFGDIYPFDDAVKLDPTVERTLLRQQAAYLKCHGYKYNAKEQTWYAV